MSPSQIAQWRQLRDNIFGVKPVVAVSVVQDVERILADRGDRAARSNECYFRHCSCHRLRSVRRGAAERPLLRQQAILLDHRLIAQRIGEKRDLKKFFGLPPR